MNGLLAIFGTLSILILAIIGALFWLYRTRVNRWYLYGLAASVNKFPSRIRLIPQPSFQWKKPDRAAQRVVEFHQAGFEDLGGFLVEELSCSRAFVLQHPGNGLFGMVVESQELGTWSDVMCFTQNQSQPVLASSLLKRGNFRLLPGDTKIDKPEAGVAELSDAVLTAAAGQPRITVTGAVDFVEHYEHAFADAVDARLLEPLEEYELRRLVTERGQPCCGEITEKEFAQVKKLLPLAIENELRLACGAQFLRETRMSAAEWQHATQRLLIVHDRTSLPRLAGPLIYGVFLTKLIRRRLKGARRTQLPRETFAGLNARLPTWQRYKKLGEVHRPVPADVYRAPIEPTAP